MLDLRLVCTGSAIFPDGAGLVGCRPGGSHTKPGREWVIRASATHAPPPANTAGDANGRLDLERVDDRTGRPRSDPPVHGRGPAGGDRRAAAGGAGDAVTG